MTALPGFLNQAYDAYFMLGLKEGCCETIAFSYSDGLLISPDTVGNRNIVK